MDDPAKKVIEEQLSKQGNVTFTEIGTVYNVPEEEKEYSGNVPIISTISNNKNGAGFYMLLTMSVLCLLLSVGLIFCCIRGSLAGQQNYGALGVLYLIPLWGLYALVFAITWIINLVVRIASHKLSYGDILIVFFPIIIVITTAISFWFCATFL